MSKKIFLSIETSGLNSSIDKITYLSACIVGSDNKKIGSIQLTEKDLIEDKFLAFLINTLGEEKAIPVFYKSEFSSNFIRHLLKGNFYKYFYSSIISIDSLVFHFLQSIVDQLPNVKLITLYFILRKMGLTRTNFDKIEYKNKLAIIIDIYFVVTKVKNLELV